MNKEIIKKRIRAIHQEFCKRGIDCLIVTNPANVTYSTGFMGADSWVLITKKQTFLLTDSRYTEQAQKECVGCKITMRANSEPIAQAAAKLIRQLKSVQISKVRVEKSISLASFEALQKSMKTRLKTADGIIESLRSIKDKFEITAIRTAASIAAKALKQTLRQVKPGMSESELAGLLNYQIRKLGATTGFDTIVAFGPNASRPHHEPGRKILKRNDAVLIDFGARYKGYCCDITRCFAVGKSTAFYKRVFDVVEQAQSAAIELVRAGVETICIDTAAREVIAKNGLPVYEHGTGHGFGLEIHELPFLKAVSTGKLKTGEVITVEPGVYIPGRLGVRIEDDVLVTETGCRILTRKCPHRISRG
jgi:Xaa-Pro aminopeptidase